MRFLRSPVRMMRISRRRSHRRIKRDLVSLQQALAQEKAETQEMLAIYRKFTHGEATEAEMKIANEQLVDIIKGMGLGIFAILPFAPVTIPVIIKLGRRFGVDVLPSAFHQSDEEHAPSGKHPSSGKPSPSGKHLPEKDQS